MRFELAIGLRYLHGGKRRDRAMWAAAATCALVAGAGGALMATTGTTLLPAAMVIVGILGACVCALLATFAVFTAVSILGVAFGVAALTIVLAVTTGFQREFRDKVLGVNAHVMIVKEQSTFVEYHDVMRAARALEPDEVIAAQPFIFAEMLVTRGKGELSGVAIKGIDPALVRGVLDLDRYMEPPATIDVLADRTQALPPIIVGRELAHKLRAHVGDDLTIVVPLSTKAMHARTKRFRIAGVFYSGFDEYDRHLVYAALPDVQELIGRPGQVQGVELKLRHLDRAAEIAARLERRLGGKPYAVSDWYELNQTMFSALQVQKVVLVVILTLIIIVAAVNMVSALAMLVTDKTREVAILKSMGARSGSVAQVFQVVGLAIGGAGTLIGVAIGLVTCAVLDRYGFALDPKVYLIDKLPIEVHPFEVAIVACIAMAVSMVATLVPAASAAGLRPVDGLRYD